MFPFVKKNRFRDYWYILRVPAPRNLMVLPQESALEMILYCLHNHQILIQVLEISSFDSINFMQIR